MWLEDTPENLQARLVGAERSIVRVKGDTEELLPQISEIKGVQNIKIRPDGTMEFQFAPGVDVRPEVARTIINSGYDLLELSPIGLSLEEIFLELTRDEQVHQKGAVEMRNIWTIARREIRLYFASPVAYIIGLLILLITGIYFVLVIYLAGRSAFTTGYSSAPGPDLVIGLMVFLFLFAVPALSMRLMADEHRNGTLELLLTTPIREWELIVGKWLGSFLFVFSIIAITFIYPIALNKLGNPGH